ncbi:unnamed protein product [Ectocarpus sp. CCAP 1310/34]|nr:unnamed protein product [Ectocarpus sp. CCAP 1310/34]
MCSANVQHCGFVGFDEMRVGKVESERVRESRVAKNITGKMRAGTTTTVTAIRHQRIKVLPECAALMCSVMCSTVDLSDPMRYGG